MGFDMSLKVPDKERKNLVKIIKDFNKELTIKELYGKEIDPNDPKSETKLFTYPSPDIFAEYDIKYYRGINGSEGTIKGKYIDEFIDHLNKMKKEVDKIKNEKSSGDKRSLRVTLERTIIFCKIAKKYNLIIEWSF